MSKPNQAGGDSNPNDLGPSLSDQAWLTNTFREHELPLVAYAAHLLNDKDRACDVVQDAFVRLCKQDRSQIESGVKAWLYRVCRNRALDILKKERRMKTLDDATAATEVSKEAPPDSKLQQQESSSKAQSLICELPDRQQEVIRLKVHGGLSYREISEITGLSVSNVGYLLSTGLQAVRTRLAMTE